MLDNLQEIICKIILSNVVIYRLYSCHTIFKLAVKVFEGQLVVRLPLHLGQFIFATKDHIEIRTAFIYLNNQDRCVLHPTGRGASLMRVGEGHEKCFVTLAILSVFACFYSYIKLNTNDLNDFDVIFKKIVLLMLI